MKTIMMNGVAWQADDDFPEEILKQQNDMFAERDSAAEMALPALKRLVAVMHGRSGQPYKVRGILFSIWNGKPTDLSELLGLDWEIRKDLCQVLLAFGHESKKVKFFYAAIETAVKASGLWEWFLEESENLKGLREFLKARDDQ